MDREDVVYICINIYICVILLSHKKWDFAICDNMDGYREYYANRNKSDKDEYHIISLLCGIYKNKTNKTVWKETHRYREQMGCLQRGGKWVGSKIGEGD